jgi:hypothetical protein
MEIRVAAPSPDPQNLLQTRRPLRPDEYRTIKLIFADGRLTHFDGKELTTIGKSGAAGRLFALLDTGLLDDRTHTELGKNSQVDFVEIPPRDAFLYMSELHGILIVVDPKVDPDHRMAITADYEGVDLASLLLLLTAPHHLGCDYRYGALWITTADDCEDWHDPTEIEKIKPTPGSPLARAWNEPIGIDFFYSPPLKASLDSIEQKVAISIDTSRVPDELPRKANLPVPPGPWAPNAMTAVGASRGRPLHHVLGHLLYLWRCRCELDGETLVILPEDSK